MEIFSHLANKIHNKMTKHNNPQAEIITLKQWYDALPASKQQETFEALRLFLGKSKSALYNWINAKSVPDMANRKMIQEFTEIDIHYPITPEKVS